mgnify:CR=1 FL=1
MAQSAMRIWKRARGGAWSPILIGQIVVRDETHVAETEGNHSTGHSADQRTVPLGDIA